MNPTFKTGDILHFAPYNEKKVCVGDVIVFLSPNKNHKIVHRVISIDQTGIRTRGDGNKKNDDWILENDDIIGQVFYVQKKRVKLPVYGGIIGRIYAISIKPLREVKRFIWPLLKPFC